MISKYCLHSFILPNHGVYFWFLQSLFHIWLNLFITVPETSPNKLLLLGLIKLFIPYCVVQYWSAQCAQISTMCLLDLCQAGWFGPVRFEMENNASSVTLQPYLQTLCPDYKNPITELKHPQSSQKSPDVCHCEGALLHSCITQPSDSRLHCFVITWHSSSGLYRRQEFTATRC